MTNAYNPGELSKDHDYGAYDYGVEDEYGDDADFAYENDFGWGFEEKDHEYGFGTAPLWLLQNISAAHGQTNDFLRKHGAWAKLSQADKDELTLAFQAIQRYADTEHAWGNVGNAHALATRLLRKGLAPQQPTQAMFDELHEHFKRISSSMPGGGSSFLTNAVKVAGKAVDTVASGISTAGSAVGSVVKHIPIVGAPINQVFSSAWNLATSPLNMAVAIAHGERIDKAVLSRLESNLKDVKTIASYAQVVTSMVPGVGTGVSAALGAGMALMSGQPITDAVAAGVAGMIPGGPLAQAVVKMGYSGIKAAATGERLDIESLSKTGLGALGSSIGLPPAATRAVVAGVAMTGSLARGVPPETAIAAGAINVLPVPPATKEALHQANALAQALAKGQRVDRTALAAADKAFQYLPVSNELKKQVKESLRTGKGILTAKNPNEILAVGLQTGLADKLISSSGMPKHLQTALVTGMAVGTAKTKQAQRGVEIATAAGKLVQSGVQQAKVMPTIGAARRLVGAGTRGFDLGHGVMQMRSSAFDVTTARNTLKTPHDLKGFDMALAQRIGQVVTPPMPKMSAAARAGYTMTIGMRGYLPAHKAAMMKNISADASAAVGAKAAVKAVATEREGLLRRILRALGFKLT